MRSLSKRALFIPQILNHDFLRSRYCIKSSGSVEGVWQLCGRVKEGLKVFLKKEVPDEWILKDEWEFPRWVEAVVSEPRKPQAQRHGGIVIVEYLADQRWFSKVGVRVRLGVSGTETGQVVRAQLWESLNAIPKHLDLCPKSLGTPCCMLSRRVSQEAGPKSD